MTTDIELIAPSETEKHFLAVVYAYAHETHRGEFLKFGRRDPFINHPIEVAEKMPTVFLQAAGLLHDVLESTVERTLGKHPEPAAEQRLIKQAKEQLGAYLAVNGFPSAFPIGQDKTGIDLLDVTDSLTQRRSRYTQKDEVAAYLRNLDREQKVQFAEIAPDRPHYLKLLQYSLYLKEGPVEFARTTGDVGAVHLKLLGDIENNSDPARNPVIADSDQSGWAIKERARLFKYQLARGYLQPIIEEMSALPRVHTRFDIHAVAANAAGLETAGRLKKLGVATLPPILAEGTAPISEHASHEHTAHHAAHLHRFAVRPSPLSSVANDDGLNRKLAHG